MATQQAKKKIPKFSTPSTQTREIDGLSVTVRRLPASRAPQVLSRLLAGVGEALTEIASNPDRDLDPDLEAGVRMMLAKAVSTEAAISASMGIVKFILFSNALTKGEHFDLEWFVRELLPGLIDVEGVPIDTMEELDETEIGPVPLMTVLWFAVQVNFFPTSAGLATCVGDEPPALTQNQPQARSTTGKSSLKGASMKAGQRAPTSAGTASSG